MSKIKPKLQTLKLPLSPNLLLHITTTVQPIAVGPTSDTETSICLVKKEVVEFADHNVFKKAFIQLTPEKLSFLRENIDSVTTLRDYTSHYLKKHVQQSTPRTVSEALHSAPKTTHRL